MLNQMVEEIFGQILSRNFTLHYATFYMLQLILKQ